MTARPASRCRQRIPSGIDDEQEAFRRFAAAFGPLTLMRTRSFCQLTSKCGMTRILEMIGRWDTGSATSSGRVFSIHLFLTMISHARCRLSTPTTSSAAGILRPHDVRGRCRSNPGERAVIRGGRPRCHSYRSGAIDVDFVHFVLHLRAQPTMFMSCASRNHIADSGHLILVDSRYSVARPVPRWRNGRNRVPHARAAYQGSALVREQRCVFLPRMSGGAIVLAFPDADEAGVGQTNRSP